jgi:hypothetical protein
MTTRTFLQACRARVRACLRGKRITRFVKEVLVAVAFGIGLAFFVQLAVGEEFATRGYARLYAPLAGAIYGEHERAQTTVMLIDDATRADAGETWPARYAYHARLAKALARYRPKAVFFDIYFSQARSDPSLPALAEALCALRRQGTEVFLGAVPDAEGSDSLRAELEALAGKCFHKVGLQYTPDSLDRLAWTYPLREQSEDGVLPNAALAIYEHAYAGRIPEEEGELALTWGLSTAAYGVRWVEPGAAESSRLYCRADMGWRDALLPAGAREKLAGNDKPLCVFHNTLYAGDLAAGSEEEEAVLKQLLQGRTVMVGTALANSPDRVQSPLHGRIPGVYLHAMALDNLLTYGAGYPREIHLIGKIDSAHLWLYLFLALSVTLGTIGHRAYKACHERKAPEGAAGGRFRLLGEVAREGAWKIGKALALPVAVGFAVFIGQYVFQIGLMTIIDIVIFTLTAEWLELNEKFLGFLEKRKAGHAAANEDQSNDGSKHEQHHTQ